MPKWVTGHVTNQNNIEELYIDIKIEVIFDYATHKKRIETIEFHLTHLHNTQSKDLERLLQHEHLGVTSLL